MMDSYDVVLFPCQGGAGDYDAANGFPNTLGEPHQLHERRRAHVRHALPLRPARRRQRQLRDDGELGQRRLVGRLLRRPEVQRRHRPDLRDRGQRSPTGSTRPSCTAGRSGRSRSASSATTSRPWSRLRSAGCSPPIAAGAWPPDHVRRPRRIANIPIHYTFDTPFEPAAPRNLRSRRLQRLPRREPAERRPTSRATSSRPSARAATPGSMTPQEKLLEFMLFDLTSCVSPPTCTPLTCASFPAGTCGVQGDGCGGADRQLRHLHGSRDLRRRRRRPASAASPTPARARRQTCAQQNINCGPAGDGCGNVLSAAPARRPRPAAAAASPGQCGYPDGGACNPETCAQQNINCGPAGDGCGNELMCGTCTPPADLRRRRRGRPVRLPRRRSLHATDLLRPEHHVRSCRRRLRQRADLRHVHAAPDLRRRRRTRPVRRARRRELHAPVVRAQNIDCGPAGDGCGNELMCGACTSPQTCGGGGVPGQCGLLDGGTACRSPARRRTSPAVRPATAAATCCSAVRCTSPQTCGGGGVSGQCGGGAMSQ